MIAATIKCVTFILAATAFLFVPDLFAQPTLIPFSRTAAPSPLTLSGTDSVLSGTFNFQNTDTIDLKITAIVLDSADSHFIIKPMGACAGLPMTAVPGELMEVGISLVATDTNIHYNGLRFVLGNNVAPIIYPISAKSDLVPPAITALSLGGITKGMVADGATLNISWVARGNMGSGFSVEYSIDNGMYWKMIESVSAATSYVQWTNQLTGYYPLCFVRVRGYDTERAHIIKQSQQFAIGNAASVAANAEKACSILNYPNPVLNNTTFHYSLSERSIVTLSIYDVMGREISRLISDQSIDAGAYHLDFDASQLVSGSYTYILRAGSMKVTGTMMVIK